MNQSNPSWDNNVVQFSRLLCEIVATQDLDIPSLAQSMDLPVSDVDALLERAHVVWEKAKSGGSLSQPLTRSPGA